MASKRKFYRTVFTVTVLSEEPISSVSLDTLHYFITDGEGSGVVTQEESVPVDGPTMAVMLEEQGSDPGFFQLTDKGEDIEDDGTCGVDADASAAVDKDIAAHLAKE